MHDSCGFIVHDKWLSKSLNKGCEKSLCPRPIVSIPLCTWTVKNVYDLERKCQISAFLEIFSKRLPVLFFFSFFFNRHLKQCSIANFFV